ncbi:MAG: DUF4124 domain-containing protein [Gammaproteobacteria bacterium]
MTARGPKDDRLTATLPALAGALLLYCGACAGAGVYKWVDAQGKVHYGDRPGAGNAAPLSIRSGAPVDTPVPDEAARREKRDRLLNAFAEEKAEKKAKAAEAGKKRAEGQRNCRIAQQRLRDAQDAGFLYEYDDKGERRIFSNDERAAAQARAGADVNKWCR